ncbi:hypothetical protein [Metabacillus fastidiosus]|uniref:hypothetical protein n=1 Tax=Metabacillus fastidiosus TaxID=1458 RepID=UPI002DBC0F08|nr:hypothetical protein [Metabacillus fastidiosus]MEC2077742.1 hypothetical protein [Metabacillus fastidiosus]
MNISSLTSYQSELLYSKNGSSQSKINQESVFSINKTIEPEKNGTLTYSGSSNVWKEISSKYNVRKATFEDIQEISQKLYEAGEISLAEHAILIFDCERVANDIKHRAHVPVSPNFSMYETVSNQNGERDWIAEFEARVKKDFKYGNLLGHQHNMKVLNILQRLAA